MSENPYQPPKIEESKSQAGLHSKLAGQFTYLREESRMWFAGLVLPFLSLLFLVRVAQVSQLRRQVLRIERQRKRNGKFAKQLRSTYIRYWIGVVAPCVLWGYLWWKLNTG